LRSVFALLGLVRRWGASGFEAACAAALDHEVVKVSLITRMLERATEGIAVKAATPATVTPARFAHDPAHFAVAAPNRPHLPHPDGPEASTGVLADGFEANVAGEAR
jgi:hypothetical protein